MLYVYVNTYTYAQLRTATCKVLMYQCMKQLLLKSLPAVLDGLGCVLGCISGGDVDLILAVSGSERGI